MTSITKMTKYVLVEFPHSQQLMDEEWFDEECFPINNLEKHWIGDGAYFVPVDRYEEYFGSV